MSILNWLFGRKKKEIVKPDPRKHWAYTPRSNYYGSLKNADKDDEYEKRRKRQQEDDSNSLLSPFNPVGPLYDSGNNDTPAISNDFSGFDGGSGGGGGASGDWSSGSSDSGSSYDSGSSDSGSSSDSSSSSSSD